MKGLINIKNKDLKCFLWCHIRLINPTNTFPEIIKKKDKEIVSTLYYSDIHFPMKTHDYELVEERFEMNVNAFCYENKVYPIYISKISNTQVSNVLLITSEENHTTHLLKILTGSCIQKQKQKIKTFLYGLVTKFYY